ncbi:MAG TPA: response regulator transcription factor [Solirubrobacteraceae bacterium]
MSRRPTAIGDDDIAPPAAHLHPPTASAVRVQVAETSPLYREGLVRWLQDCAELELVALAAEGHGALAQLRRCRPDVAIVDHDLAGVDGPRFTLVARRERLPTRILILAATADGAIAHRALSSGAAAYVTRDVGPAELRAAVHAVAAGRVALPPAVQTSVAREIRLRHQPDRPALAPRERQILALVANDCSTRIIAERLHLSNETVKTHLRHVYRTLEVSDRAAAVARAMHLGLVE